MKQIYYVEMDEGVFMVRSKSEDEAFELLANHLDSSYLEIYDFELIKEDVEGESQVLLH